MSPFLAACKARGWVKARGAQWTDATPVLAAIRTFHRLACVLEAMHWALNQLSDVALAWVRQQVPRLGTHRQQLLNATAMHVVRVIAWLWGES